MEAGQFVTLSGCPCGRAQRRAGAVDGKIVSCRGMIILVKRTTEPLEATNVLFMESIVPVEKTSHRSNVKSARASVSDLLFPAIYRRKALALLLLSPEKRLHAREIARLTGCAPSAMAKELGLLHQAEILDRYTVGNQAQFSANARHPVFSELSALLRKTVGLADVLAAALAPLEGRLRIAFVFGSVARGEEHGASDVDVVVIGEVDFAEVTKALYPTQEVVRREVNPKVFTIAEWRSRLASKSTFVGDILAKPKIFIVGTEDELDLLGKPSEEQAP